MADEPIGRIIGGHVSLYFDPRYSPDDSVWFSNVRFLGYFHDCFRNCIEILVKEMALPSVSIPVGPVGYRFKPTDEELINHYLMGKISGREENEVVIAEVDVCKYEPWDLPVQSAIKNEDEEWFFLSPKQRKYPSGDRSNRATKIGFWKATGKDRTIKSRKSGNERVIGSKKTLIFHIGRAPAGKRTSWTIHEYSANNQDPYVICRLFKQDEEPIAIENSTDAERAIKSEVPSNQRNIKLGLQEELCVLPVDEVNSVASHTVIQEGSTFTPANLETEALIPIESSNAAMRYGLSCTPTWSSSSGLASEMPSNQGNIESGSQEEFPVQQANKVNSVPSDTVIQEQSNFKSVNLCTDDSGAETNVNLQDNSDIIFADSLLNLDDDSAVSHTVIQEGSGVIQEANVDIDDLRVEDIDLSDILQVIKDETVNDRSAIIHSANEFLNENYESEFFTSLFNSDAASDLITENQIPEMDFDSVTFDSSSSYNLRTTPSENQLIRHVGGEDHRTINEFVSEESTNQYAETGITIRSRRTRVSASDPSRQHQGTAPRRILLPSRRPLDESCERIQQPKLRRSGFALVLVTSVLVIVYAGWKWFRGQGFVNLLCCMCLCT